MTDQKEKFSGVWNGRPVRFNRVFRGKRLTDEQCEALCAGEEVEIPGLTSLKTGNEYGIIGRLAELDSRDGSFTFIGIEQVDFMKRRRGVPREMCQHVFTDDERTMLEAGMTVDIRDFVSRKTGNTFGCKCTYNEDEDKIEFHFDH